jgi:hypothetical protein
MLSRGKVVGCAQRRGAPRRAAGTPLPETVEVAGIEPASSVALTGLLRAQCALPLLGPTGPAHEPVWRAQSL